MTQRCDEKQRSKVDGVICHKVTVSLFQKKNQKKDKDSQAKRGKPKQQPKKNLDQWGHGRGYIGGISLLFLAPTQKGKLKIPYKSPIVPMKKPRQMSQDQPITRNHSDLKQKYDLQIIKQKLNSAQLNSTPPTPKSPSCFLLVSGSLHLKPFPQFIC